MYANNVLRNDLGKLIFEFDASEGPQQNSLPTFEQASLMPIVDLSTLIRRRNIPCSADSRGNSFRGILSCFQIQDCSSIIAFLTYALSLLSSQLRMTVFPYVTCLLLRRCLDSSSMEVLDHG